MSSSSQVFFFIVCVYVCVHIYLSPPVCVCANMYICMQMSRVNKASRNHLELELQVAVSHTTWVWVLGPEMGPRVQQALPALSYLSSIKGNSYW